MTAATTAPSPRYAAPTTPRVRRFSVEEYHRMIEDRYFAHDERFELLEGWIVAKVSRNPIHDAVVSITLKALEKHIPSTWHVRVQSGFTTADSEPEPDLAVVRGDERDYVARHPGAADAALVIEVANTTLVDDREWKGRIYARAGVQCYWIINLVDRQVEVYTGPSGPAPASAFARSHDYSIADSIPLNIPGASPTLIPVRDLMP